MPACGRAALACVLAAFAGVACSDDGGPTQLVYDCSTDGRKAFIASIMTEYYLWYDQIPELDYASVPTAEELLDKMIYKERDHWSGMQLVVERDRFYGEGRFDGLGYTLGTDQEGGIRIAWVHERSPAGAAQLDRGARLIAINDRPVAELVADGTLYAELSTAVVKHTVEDLSGSVRELDIVPGEITITSVKATSVLETSAGPVGYFMFTSFIGPAEDELKAAFASFQAWEAEHQQPIDKLVVDLRYNGGGLLTTAALLGSLIERRAAGQPLIIETYNARHPELNRERNLFQVDQAISVSQVVFLTGPGTASASEQVINGLRPYADVETVGSTTLGKPVGADSWKQCGFALAPITFHSLNAAGEGDYFEGIDPACDAEDDLLHALGDPEEEMLKAGLALIEGQLCEPVGALRSAPVGALRSAPLDPLRSAPVDPLRSAGGRARRAVRPALLPGRFADFPGLF